MTLDYFAGETVDQPWEAYAQAERDRPCAGGSAAEDLRGSSPRTIRIGRRS